MSISLANLTPLSPHFGIQKKKATLKKLDSRISLLRSGNVEIACTYVVCRADKSTHNKAMTNVLMRAFFGVFGLPELHCAFSALPGKPKRTIFFTQIYYEPETSLMLQPQPVTLSSVSRDALLRLSALHIAFGYDMAVRHVLAAEGVYHPSSYTRAPRTEPKLSAQLEKLHDGLPRLFCDILAVQNSRNLLQWRARTLQALAATTNQLGSDSAWVLDGVLSRIAEYVRPRLAFLREIEGQRVLEDSYGLERKPTSRSASDKS